MFKKYAAFSPSQKTDWGIRTHEIQKKKRKHFGQLNLTPLPQVISQRQLQICKIKPWTEALAGGPVVRSELRLHRGEAKQDGSVGRFEIFSIKKGVLSFSSMRFGKKINKKNLVSFHKC